MTKQTKTLAVLAAALVVCGGAYAGLRVWNDRQAQIDDTVYLTQLSDLTGLTLTNSAGTLSFTKTDGAWQYDGDSAFPANQTAVEGLAEQVGSLAAIRVIDDPENLESLELLDLAAIPDFPDLGTDTISSLTWESGGTPLTLTKTETTGTESGDSSADASTSSESSGETEPAWDVNGTAIPADNSIFTSLMAQLSSLAFDACCDYKGEADTLAACGLDDPVGVLTVTYGEGETFTLTLGALDGTGDAYYAQLSGDPAVYLLSRDPVSTLTSLTPEALTAADQEETEAETDGTEAAADPDTSTGSSSAS